MSVDQIRISGEGEGMGQRKPTEYHSSTVEGQVTGCVCGFT